MSKVNKILMERCKDMYKTPSYTEGSINSRDGHCFFWIMIMNYLFIFMILLLSIILAVKK